MSGIFNSLANAAGLGSGGASHGLANAAQGSLLIASNGISSQHLQAAVQAGQVQVERSITRLYIEVDIVDNGYMLNTRRQRLIAKDLDELQQLFVAQVAELQLERSK